MRHNKNKISHNLIVYNGRHTCRQGCSLIPCRPNQKRSEAPPITCAAGRGTPGHVQPALSQLDHCSSAHPRPLATARAAAQSLLVKVGEGAQGKGVTITTWTGPTGSATATKQSPNLVQSSPDARPPAYYRWQHCNNTPALQQVRAQPEAAQNRLFTHLALHQHPAGTTGQGLA